MHWHHQCIYVSVSLKCHVIRGTTSALSDTKCDQSPCRINNMNDLSRTSKSHFAPESGDYHTHLVPQKKDPFPVARVRIDVRPVQRRTLGCIGQAPSSCGF